MSELIEAKVKIDPDDLLKTQVIVRKVVRDDGGMCVGIYGLSRDGQWVRKAEGKAYPEECYLPVYVYDDREITEAERQWMKEQESS